MGVVDGKKKFGPRLVELAGGLIVADFIGDCIQLFKGASWFEVLICVGKGFEFLIRGHHLLVAVAFSDTAFVVDLFGREKAGAVEVEIRRENALGEGVDLGGEMARDVGVT